MRNARHLSFESFDEIVNCPWRGTDEVTDGASAPDGRDGFAGCTAARSSTRVAVEDRPESLHVSGTAIGTLRMASCVLPGSIENLRGELAVPDSVNS
jgi:hypothetical protein